MSRGHDFSADHWALGILLYEMLEGENPFYFEGMDQILLFKSIVDDTHKPLSNSSPEAMRLVDALLEKDPVQRLGSLKRGEAEILQHEWFDGLDLQELRHGKITAPWIPPLSGPLDSSCFDDWSEVVDKSTLKFAMIREKHAKEFEGF